MTTVKLLDFLSVMLCWKKQDAFDVDSKIIFGQKQIVNFIEEFREYAIVQEIVRICILNRQFKLALTLFHKFKIDFELEFLRQALIANCFDMAFYLMETYEDAIFSDPLGTVDALV